MIFNIIQNGPTLFYAESWDILNAIIITFFATFIGAALGSFSTVVASRYKTGRKPWNPARSYCPKCAKPLSLIQNTPILGWILQLGKCWGCKAKIPKSYVIIELIYAATWFLCMTLPQTFLTGIVIGLILTIILTIIQTTLRHKIWKNYEKSKVPMHNNNA